jgi:hypothetical protein
MEMDQNAEELKRNINKRSKARNKRQIKRGRATNNK